MNIEDIRIILQVAECSSINRASLISYKTQSQVSRIIKKFEASLNVTIFERSTKGVRITPDGYSVLSYCQQIVSLYDEMTAKPCIHPIDYHGNLKFYTTLNIWPTISEIIGSFSRQYPNIHIEQKTVNPSTTIEAVASDPSAIGFIFFITSNSDTQSNSIPPSVIYKEIFQVPIVALCSINSDFFQKYKTISDKTISKLPLVDFHPNESTPSIAAMVLDNIGAKYCFHYSTDDLRVLQQLLLSGTCLYIGILPSPKLLSTDIVNIPIRSNLKISFGSVINQAPSDVALLFNKCLIEQYHKIY